jgi:predicted lipoprotein
MDQHIQLILNNAYRLYQPKRMKELNNDDLRALALRYNVELVDLSQYEIEINSYLATLLADTINRKV